MINNIGNFKQSCNQQFQVIILKQIFDVSQRYLKLFLNDNFTFKCE